LFIYKKDSGYNITDWDSPDLRKGIIGLVGQSPPSRPLSDHGLMENARPYRLQRDLNFPPSFLVDDLVKGDLDVAIVWGPIGGYFAKNAPIPPGMFAPQAEQRVKLGLILNQLVKDESLKPSPEQIKAEIDEQAASYEDPQQVTLWYYSDPKRLGDIESLVMENNVVAYVLSKAKVIDKKVTFEELSVIK
jgi:hypothetical protein